VFAAWLAAMTYILLRGLTLNRESSVLGSPSVSVSAGAVR
jgi:hypothetical protein